MSYLTSHINKVRTGEAKREAEEDRLTFDRWWLVNPWVRHYLHANTDSQHSCLLLLLLLSLFFCPLPCCRIKPRSQSDICHFSCFPLFSHDSLAKVYTLVGSSSGEVVLKCDVATLAPSPAANPRAYKETNLFILSSTLRWGGRSAPAILGNHFAWGSLFLLRISPQSDKKVKTNTKISIWEVNFLFCRQWIRHKLFEPSHTDRS